MSHNVWFRWLRSQNQVVHLEEIMNKGHQFQSRKSHLCCQPPMAAPMQTSLITSKYSRTCACQVPFN